MMSGKEPDEADLVAAREIVIELFEERFKELKALNDFECAVLSEADSLRDYLIGTDSRTFCILAISFMEDMLRRTFIQHWKIEGKSALDNYFGSNGPLNTFSQRVLVATGLAWMTMEDQRQTSLLRKIRNEFAHNHKVMALADEPLASWANALHPAERVWDREEMLIYREAYQSAPRETVLRLRIYCNSIFLVSKVLARAKLIGAELPPDFRAGSGFNALTGIEQAFIDHAIKHCFKTLGIMRSGA